MRSASIITNTRTMMAELQALKLTGYITESNIKLYIMYRERTDLEVINKQTTNIAPATTIWELTSCSLVQASKIN